MSPNSGRKPVGRFYTVCIAVTLIILIALFAMFLLQRSEVAPVYVLTVSGLDADNPADAQAFCRREYKRCAECAEDYDDVLWVWCSGERLYLVKADALTELGDSAYPDFTHVSFIDENGKTHKGYVIDPAVKPRELLRIRIADAEEYTFENVSMSIRTALRNGDIALEGAVYLWEEGSDTVFAVSAEKYTEAVGEAVSFTDDGGISHVCLILDTTID